MKYIKKYVPTSQSSTINSSNLRDLKRLTSYFLTGMINIYAGHTNPQDAEYLSYKEWFNSEWCQTNLIDNEEALKNLLKEFDRNFDQYKDSKFFRILSGGNSIKGSQYINYNKDANEQRYFDINEFISDTTRNGRLVPVSELNSKLANANELQDDVIILRNIIGDYSIDPAAR